VVAVEPTGYMRRVLGIRRLAQRARARIDVVDGAAEATGLADASVDVLWAVNSMHHWTEPEEAYRELARVMRPGGRLLLVDEDFDDPDHPDHDSFSERHSEHQHHFSMVEVSAVAGGLRAVDVDVAVAGKEMIAGVPALVVEATKPTDDAAPDQR